MTPPPGQPDTLPFCLSLSLYLYLYLSLSLSLSRRRTTLNPGNTSLQPLARFAGPTTCILTPPGNPPLPSDKGTTSQNVQQFRGGLAFKAHRLLYHSALGLRVIKKKKNKKTEQLLKNKKKEQQIEDFCLKMAQAKTRIWPQMCCKGVPRS